MATTIPEPVTTILTGTLRLLLTSISYRADPSAGASGAELASDPQTVGADPAAAGMVCPLIYLIIIGGCADLCSVWRGGGIWYLLSASGRVYALQRGAGGIIPACVGLVSWAVERVQSQEKPLQSPVRCFVECVV